MKKVLTQYGALALAVALMMPLAQAQTTRIQAAFGDDAGTPQRELNISGISRIRSGSSTV